MTMTDPRVEETRSFLERCHRAVTQTEAEGPLTPIPKEILTGYSGDKVLAVLQRLTAALLATDACYLEVGVFQGLSLLSVAMGCPGVHCYGIDNFAFFDPKGKNLGMVRDRARLLGVQNITIINEDYEVAFARLDSHLSGRSVAVYFVDGPHDYRSQLQCLELALPHLHRDSVIVIDDSNYRHVRQANRDFLVTHPDWKLLCQAYTSRHPMNMPESERAAAVAGWWNGINILVHDPAGELETRLPPTGDNRRIFEAEHVLFSSAVADAVPGLAALGAALAGGHPVKALWHGFRVWNEGRRIRRDNPALLPAMNTYSDALPAFWQASQRSSDDGVSDGRHQEEARR